MEEGGYFEMCEREKQGRKVGETAQEDKKTRGLKREPENNAIELRAKRVRRVRGQYVNNAERNEKKMGEGGNKGSYGKDINYDDQGKVEGNFVMMMMMLMGMSGGD